jgi:hypothetical protein
MKKWIVYLIFILVSGIANAQTKRVSTLIGFHVGIDNSKLNVHSNFSKYKIGLPSFSYATSIEQRLKIRNKLSFSLQYSVNYFSFSKRMLNSTILHKKEIINSIGVNSNFQLAQKTFITIGLGVEKSFFAQNKYAIKADHSSLNTTENKFTIKDFNKFNPYFLIGIENGIQLLNKNLYYSLQYNLGFNSLKSPKSSNETNSSNEFRIGLKYKY